MDNSETVNSGFDPKVINQLNHLSMNAAPNQRGRGRGRGRGYHSSNHQNHQGHHQGANFQYSNNLPYQPPTQQWNHSVSAPPRDVDSFPPLGFAHTPAAPAPSHQQHHQQQQQTRQSRHTYSQQQHPQQYQNISALENPPGLAQQAQPPARDFFERTRGGPGGGNRQQRNTNGEYRHQQHYPNSHDYVRPPPNTGNRLFMPGPNPHFGTSEQQRAFRHKIMSQSDFLASLASQNLKNQMTTEEAQAKEAFRKQIQTMAQHVIAGTGREALNFNVEDVRLRLYGSLGSGFGIAGSDMDILLVFPQTDSPIGGIEIECRRLLEKALLDAGYGARLLTNTRVPILKVCEKPSTELLENLRKYRLQWENESVESVNKSLVDRGNEQLPTLTADQDDAATRALALLDLDAADIPLPASPVPEQAKLEFSGDCGIQCDINFSNHVALHNTELLKVYGQCDTRVRQMGIFVKNWAKARDINTPYRGTLSSYGYILMVLHYLMNIVQPPLIPNLQQAAKDQDEWERNTNIALVEGFDVRFVRDPEHIKQIMQNMTKNKESLGSLLRGFFWYYAVPQGFHWGQDVVSIRTKGGRMTKRSKGWTEAKWSGQNQQVRLRYLLAIEDPFEVEHNVGRTVGHSGIVAIRDEFRRAWAIIDGIQYEENNKTWFWLDKGQKQDAYEFMAVLRDRGDLLRRDQVFHREKMRRMRQDLETKEHALKKEGAEEDDSIEETNTHGTWTDTDSQCPSGSNPLGGHDVSTSKLIHHRSPQGKNREWKSKNSRRQVEEQDESVNSVTTGSVEDRCIHEERDCRDHVQSSKNHQENLCKEKEDPSSGDPSKEDPGHAKVQSEVVSQRQDQLSTMGDKIFARDKTASALLEPHNRSHRADKKVGRLIFWDELIWAGRWLRWRDAQLRANRWAKPTDTFLRNLDEEFPYDPDMSYAQLAVMNRDLRDRHANILQPPTVQIERGVTKSSAMSQPRRMTKDQSPPMDKAQPEVPAQMPDIPREVTHGSESGTELGSEISSSAVLSPPITIDDLRAKRVEYYSQKAAPNGPTSTACRPKCSEHGDSRTTSASSSGLKHQTQTNSTQPDPHPRGFECNKPTIHNDQAHKSRPAQPSKNSLPSHQQNLLSLLNTSLLPHPEQSVPTLFRSNVLDDRRPRGEDSGIMPVSRKVGFVFDPRQLADLDVIKQGGNGCAMDGEEFNIEEDYEFGGGGAMGYRSSSGAYYSHETNNREHLW